MWRPDLAAQRATRRRHQHRRAQRGLDLAATATLGDLFNEEITRRGVTAVRVDLPGATFIEFALIGILLKARHAATANTCAFSIARAYGNVRRVLTVAGVLDALTTDPIEDPT